MTDPSSPTPSGLSGPTKKGFPGAPKGAPGGGGPSGDPSGGRFAKKPRSVTLPRGELVTYEPLREGQLLPLVIRPTVPDVDLVEWAREHRQLVDDKLLEHGGLLFRGFGIPTTERFERVAQAITPNLADDNGELPRSNVSRRIYSVSYAPPEQAILWHSENSFCPRWPMRLWFYCELPAEVGGETPMVDNRLVLERLAPEVREKFQEVGIAYLRNFGRGLDFTWQTAFQTEDRQEVERRCQEGDIEYEWIGSDGFRTRTVRPAIVRHPRTGDEVFFCQPALWHMASSPHQRRDALLSFFRVDQMPRHCTYGDGTPIEDDAMRAILDIYRETEVVFPWQQGDAVLLDNMLCAHARNPFEGRRKIFAAMADQISDQELSATA